MQQVKLLRQISIRSAVAQIHCILKNYTEFCLFQKTNCLKEAQVSSLK